MKCMKYKYANSATMSVIPESTRDLGVLGSNGRLYDTWGLCLALLGSFPKLLVTAFEGDRPVLSLVVDPRSDQPLTNEDPSSVVNNRAAAFLAVYRWHMGQTPMESQFWALQRPRWQVVQYLNWCGASSFNRAILLAATSLKPALLPVFEVVEDLERMQLSNKGTGGLLRDLQEV